MGTLLEIVLFIVKWPISNGKISSILNNFLLENRRSLNKRNFLERSKKPTANEFVQNDVFCCQSLFRHKYAWTMNDMCIPYVQFSYDHTKHERKRMHKIDAWKITESDYGTQVQQQCCFVVSLQIGNALICGGTIYIFGLKL